MVSCEKLTSIEGSLHSSAIGQHMCLELTEEPVPEQQLCLEEGGNLIDSNADTNNNAPDDCPEFPWDVNSDLNIECLSSANVVESNCVESRDGLVGGFDNVGCLDSEKLLDDESGVCGDLLKEGESGVHYSQGRIGGLSLETVAGVELDNSLDDGCEASGNCLKVGASEVDNCEVKTDGLCLENVVCLNLEKSLDDGCGASGNCLKECTNEANDCNMNTDGVCFQKQESRGENGLINLSGCKFSLEVMTPARDCIQEEQEKDEKSVSGHQEVGFMEENGDALTRLHTDTCDQPSSSNGCEMPSKLIITTLPRDCVQEEQKGAMITASLSVGGVLEVMDDQDHGLAQFKDIRDQMLPSQGCAMPSDSAPLTFLTNNCIQQGEEKVDKIGDCPSAEAVVQQSNLSANIKKHALDQMIPSQDCQMPLELITLACFPRGFAQQDGQRDDQIVNISSAEAVMEVVERVSEAVETKCVADTVIVALPAQLCLKSLKSLPMADKMSDCAQQNEQRVYKSATVSYTDDFTEFVEEKNDIRTDSKVKSLREKIPVDDNACNLKDASFKGASSCFVDCPEQTETEGKVSVRVNCVSETKCAGTVSSFSRRRSTVSKSTHNQTEGAARKCRNTTKVPNPDESIEIIFNAARRKRSCISKPARSSMWGLLGNVMEFLLKSDGLVINQFQNKRILKAKGVQRSGIREKSRAGRGSRGLSRKWHASGSCLHLKVKLGKGFDQDSLNVMVPEVVDPSASANFINSDYGTEVCRRSSIEFPRLDSGVQEKLAEEGTKKKFQHFDKTLEEAKTYSDASSMDVHIKNKDLENVISDKVVGDDADDHLGIPFHLAVEPLEGALENRYIDPGTSPDSEVIDVGPDTQVDSRCREDLHDAVLISSNTLAAPGDVISSKTGQKKGKFPHAGNCLSEVRVPGASINKAKPLKKRGGRRKTDNGFNSSEGLTSSTVTNASSNTLSCNSTSVKQFLLSRDTDLRVSGEALKLESGAETKTCCNLNVCLGPSEPHDCRNMLPSAKSEGHQLSKNLKSGVSKGKSKVFESAKSRRRDASRPMGNPKKLLNKSRVKEKAVCDQVGYRMGGDPESADDYRNKKTGDSNASAGPANMDMVSVGVVEQGFPSENAWVSCDDCHKWRRIPVPLANSLDENCRWVCKDNMDKAYADCSFPQEKSNADINAELGISDAEEDAYNGRWTYKGSEKGLDYRNVTVPQNSRFKRIDTNEFLRRSRKTQTIDEIMVCHCKPPPDGQLGCGDECLNRMLNIECVQGTCPCGDLCSNQQFQKRKYASMRWDRCGRKGYGLLMSEHIFKGHFLIEYVGEVLDMHAYEERQKQYALKGHKHFYFMTLNGSEVIDACAKGNLGRFINHSCDPNCRTEKWMVNGEICIGLFALRDIKKDEEVTFDYNYVRVFGAAAKKCFCGSPYCRGYIGGDPLNTEVIIEGDSDEEYPEPVMLEDGETWVDLDQVISRTSYFNGAEIEIVERISKDRDKMENLTVAVGPLEITSEMDDSVNQSDSTVSQIKSSVEMGDLKGKISSVVPVKLFVQTEDIKNKPSPAGEKESSMEDEITDKTSCTIQRLETSATMMLGKPSSDGKRIFRKSRFRLKTSHPSRSIKKGKVSSNPPNGNKVQMIANKAEVLAVKPKKVMEASNGRFEAVQEKLNELLDAYGGISKRKDAPKGYLKLLLLTAASGGSGNSEAIQSNRDLSMIIDALLKTKSRVVLIDIINKNGLRMLHNIMKQYRRDFKKIPILRKLLKVLEYLAMREILTLEHINGGPPCPGMERFYISSHRRKVVYIQVHQIARNFRDRWIPRPIRKLSHMDRDDGRVEFCRSSNCNRMSSSQNHQRDQGGRPTEAIDSVKKLVHATTSVGSTVSSSIPSAGSCLTNGTKTRKRKSRWDQPAETNPDSRSLQHKEQKIDESLNADNGRQNDHEDLPPGFSSPHEALVVSSNVSSTATALLKENVYPLKCPSGVVIGYPQQKFISRVPVSYGVPVPIVQQFGSPQVDTVGSWAIAPGMPFHPFPPLPPFPHYSKDTPTSAVSMPTNEPAQQEQRDRCGPAACYPDENIPSTTASCLSDMDISGGNIQQELKEGRGSSPDLCKRYFRQQKWNKTKFGPPCLWRRNGQGYLGNNSRGEPCNTDVGNLTNDHRSS
ncbi:SET domain-containing protein/zf-CW domain-containing protein, partial [Cephalotus follicularis]